MFTLFIQSNSPGELISWVIPFVIQFKSHRPESVIKILLTPCQYASGQEQRILSEIPEIDQVYSPRKTLSFVFSKQTNFYEGAILFLGGDPLYSRLLSKKLNLPAYAYTEHKKFSKKGFESVFYKHIDGDLMSARFFQCQSDKQSILNKYQLEDKDYCLFMCGSRPIHYKYLMPIFIKIATYIAKQRPDFSPLFLISPFLPKSTVDSITQSLDLSKIKFVSGDSLELMSVSKMMVTIPGTNNAEAMYLNLPFMVFIPLNRAQSLILDGVLGYIIKLPLIGNIIVQLLYLMYLIKKPFFSHPNIILNDNVVPEFVEKLSEEKTGKRIINYFYDNSTLQEITKKLKRININDSIVKKIINKISAYHDKA